MISIDSQVSRAESKLERLSEGFRELSCYGADAEEMAESLLSLCDVNRQALLDLGQLILLRAVRVKLEVFKLMAELSEMELIEDTEATLAEMEQFYADLERDYHARPKDEGRPQLLDYIPPLPLQPESPDLFDLSGVADPRLFRTIQGFFGDLPGPGVSVEIPQELLALVQPIDMEQLQIDVRNRISLGVTVRELASGFHFGSAGRTLGLVFMACLFLDMAGSVWLVEGEGDVEVLSVMTM